MVPGSLHDALMFEVELPNPETAWSTIQRQLKEQRVSSDRPLLDTIDSADSEVSLDAHVIAKPSICSSVNTAIYSLAAAVVFVGMVNLYTSQGQQQARIETQALQAFRV